MTALVIRSKYNCPYSKVYINKEVQVVKCKHKLLANFYRLKNGNILFHKEELIF